MKYSLTEYIWHYLFCVTIRVHWYNLYIWQTAFSDIYTCKKFAHANTLLIIDDVDDEKSLSGAIEQAIDEGIIEIIGNDNGSCRYGSIFARYSMIADK